MTDGVNTKGEAALESFLEWSVSPWTTALFVLLTIYALRYAQEDHH